MSRKLTRQEKVQRLRIYVGTTEGAHRCRPHYNALSALRGALAVLRKKESANAAHADPSPPDAGTR